MNDKVKKKQKIIISDGTIWHAVVKHIIMIWRHLAHYE